MNKRISSINDFINESEINESLEDWNAEHDYGVFYIGGSIGETKDGVVKHFPKGKGMLYYTFATAAEAKEQAKSSRSRLSPGEKSYYGMTYASAKLSPKEKEQIAELIKNNKK